MSSLSQKSLHIIMRQGRRDLERENFFGSRNQRKKKKTLSTLRMTGSKRHQLFITESLLNIVPFSLVNNNYEQTAFQFS